MAFAKLDNIEMYYAVRGKGPPVVLIAGYTCDHAFWDGVSPALSDRFQVVVFDNRGVGRTKDDGRPISVELMARDTAALIQHLQLPRPTVVGQSMGGAIVQTMLASFPDACRRCAIVNSTQAFATVATKALKSLLALREADIDFDLLVETSLPWFAGSAWLSVPENIAGFKAALSGNPIPQSIADQRRQLLAIEQFDARGWTAPWREQGIVISATEDALAPPRDGRKLAEHTGARFIEIPGGHGSPMEQAPELARLLIEFLQH